MCLEKAQLSLQRTTASSKLEGAMPIIDIHEPEVRETEVRRVAAPNLPQREILRAPAPARQIFSDSLLEFGTQNKSKALATTTSFILNCFAIGLMLAVPLMFTEELPKGQLLTFLVAPPPPPPPPPAAA